MASAKLLLYIATLLYFSTTASLLAEAQCGGFIASCQDPFSHSDGILGARCKRADGSLVSTTVDLNPHIGNDDGNMVDGAGYKSSCRGPGYVRIGDSFSVTAICKRRDGSERSTSYDVNRRVVNNNGQLAFNNC